MFLKLILNGMRNGFTNLDQHKVYQLILDCCSAWSSFRVIVLLSLIFPFEFRQKLVGVPQSVGRVSHSVVLFCICNRVCV